MERMAQASKRMQMDDICLRGIEDRDAAVLLELNNDPNTAKYVVGNPKKVTMQEQIAWMKNLYKEKTTIRFMVEYKGQSVGTIILSNIDHDVKICNLNIKILYKYRGLGIGKNALQLATGYAFGQLDMYCLTAHILEDNHASQAVFEKVGFLREGLLRSRVIKNGERRNLYSYSMLRSE